MSIIDISKSVFAKIKSLEIQTSFLADSAWRKHAVNKSLMLCGAAAAAFTFTVATPFLQSEVQRSNHSFAIGEVYKQALVNSNSRSETMALKEIRPELKVFGLFEGKPIDEAKNLPADLSDGHWRNNQKVADFVGSNIQRSEDWTSGSFSSQESVAKFKHVVDNGTSKIICHVSFNPGITKTHDAVKNATGWSDSVIAEVLVRQERAHCLEGGDQVNQMAHLKLNGAVQPGSFITDNSATIINRVSLTHNSNSVSYDDVVNLRNATQSIVRDSNGFADSVAILSLIKKGDLGVSDLGKFAAFRQNEQALAGDNLRDQDTASLLFNLERISRKILMRYASGKKIMPKIL